MRNHFSHLTFWWEWMHFRCISAEEMTFQFSASVAFSNHFHLITSGIKLLSLNSLGLLIIYHDWKQKLPPRTHMGLTVRNHILLFIIL